MAFIDRNLQQSWETNTNGIGRTGSAGLYYVDNESILDKEYKQTKSYQFITEVIGDSQIPELSLSFKTPFNNSNTKTRANLDAQGGIKYYTYLVPSTTLSTKSIISYGATISFSGTNSIVSSTVNELDFIINGFQEFSYNVATESNPSGWSYEIISNSGKYKWTNSPTASYGASYSRSNINYIADLITYDKFNISFDINVSDSLGGVNVYMVGSSLLNNSNILNWGTPLSATISTTGTETFNDLRATNIDGTKNYFVISAISSTASYVVDIDNISIFGGYHDANNTQVLPNPYNTSDITFDQGQLYSAGYVFTTNESGVTQSISTKIGNGVFKSGIWENGVWNNGWRDDTVVRDFDDVYSSILYSYDVSWKVRVRGTTSSCYFFKIGDKISVGNIVGIDINEDRKLLRGYYTVLDVGYDEIMEGSVTKENVYWVEFTLDTTFPYRRIEKDSPNHKIKITKNIWLSGGFFNGYFSGVWNNGLFKGYPKITEMFDTHWIDGFFNGGHFNSNYPSYEFTSVVETENCTIGNITLVFSDDPIHNFLVGDYVIVEKTNLLNVNQHYNGIAQVLGIDGNNVTISKNYGFRTEDNEIGIVRRYTASGLIQNFKFYDTNRSKLRSSDSNISSSIFSFDSWIDTNYDNTRAVTLGRDFRQYEPVTGKSLSSNNLYGFPTYDILSSASRFRNSFDLDYGLYKLGTKYKVFNDSLGNSSEFNEPFNELDFQSFFDAGWTYSVSNVDNGILKRTESIIATNDTIAQSYIDAGVIGEELWINSKSSGVILNNENISIQKSRYSIVELDILTHSVANYDYRYPNSDIYEILSYKNNSTLTTSSLSVTEIISTHSITGTVSATTFIDDIIIEVDLYGSLFNTVLNLKAPNGKVINLKQNNSGFGNRLNNTKFSLKDKYPKFSDISSPYDINLNNTTSFVYSDIYKMDGEIGLGSGSYISDTALLSDFGNVDGVWTLYSTFTTLSGFSLKSWNISINYRNIISTDNTISDFPILHFSNLNYEVSTVNDNVQNYKKMSYLPISKNIDHLQVSNSFRLDSIEKTSPTRFGGFGKMQKNKKYEYFYNKTDLMMSISGSDVTGGSSSTIVTDNIKLYEVDMIPFFKYFEDSNIYKGIQIPYGGVAPNIDYLNSDFVFVDNITIGLDTINSGLVDTTPICIPPLYVDPIDTDPIDPIQYIIYISSSRSTLNAFTTETSMTMNYVITPLLTPYVGNVTFQKKEINDNDWVPQTIIVSSSNTATLSDFTIRHTLNPALYQFRAVLDGNVVSNTLDFSLFNEAQQSTLSILWYDTHTGETREGSYPRNSFAYVEVYKTLVFGDNSEIPVSGSYWQKKTQSGWIDIEPFVDDPFYSLTLTIGTKNIFRLKIVGSLGTEVFSNELVYNAYTGGGSGNTGGGSGSCPTLDMMLNTSYDTYKIVGDLEIGDLLYTKHEISKEFGLYPIVNLGIILENCLQFELENGLVIKVSDSHKFETLNGDFKISNEYKVNDSLILNKDEEISIISISNIGVQEVMKIEVEDAHTYMVYGINSHNKELIDLPPN